MSSITERHSEFTSRPGDFAATLTGLLRGRALGQPEQTAYTFLVDGETEETRLTYRELDEQARLIAAWLQRAGARGERVLLLYPSGLDFIAAFFGCLYAGAVAVPAYPPRLNRNLVRLQSIIADARAQLALTTGQISARLEPVLDNVPGLKSLRWLVTDGAPEGAPGDWLETESRADALAFLQYTSGSTGTPKGVMLTHSNLLSNASLIHRVMEHTPDDKYLSWLPTFHDMGFMSGILQPLYAGIPAILMSPAAFLQSPMRWLRAVTRYGATTSGGPNFAYDLCVRKAAAERLEGLNLRSWTGAFNGAEPIRSETLERFVETFGPYGFRRETFYPCYGLAEATLMVSGGVKSAPPVSRLFEARALEQGRVLEAAGEGDRRALVGCGSSMPGQKIIIVEPATLVECGTDEVGEVWISGPSVAEGYWGRPEETAHTFDVHLSVTGEGPFLRTGDLGFLRDGELFVTGRLKDLIIVRGANHYPQDIELTVERSHASLRPGGGAAFSLEVEGEERLVVVQEVDRQARVGFDELFALIRKAVSEEHELQTHAVILVKPGSIPKTSSGKIQRRACRDAFLAGELSAVAEWRQSALSGGDASAAAAPASLRSPEEIGRWLVEHISAGLGVPPEELDPRQPLARYGLDSLLATELAHGLQSAAGVALPMTSFLHEASIARLAEEVAALAHALPTDALLPAAEEEDGDELPLSHGQQALWYVQQLTPESAAYHITHAARLEGELDAAALRRAMQALVDRHASLRSTFSAKHGEPFRYVRARAEVCFAEEDAAGWSEEHLYARLNEESLRPFDLQNGPLFRVGLFRQSAHAHVLLLSVHHLVADFWSLAVLMDELGEFYGAETSGIPARLAPPNARYSDYVRWQRSTLRGDHGEAQRRFWQEQLSGELPVLELPTDRPRLLVQSYQGAAHTLDVPAEVVRKLNDLGRGEGATLYMTLLAAFQVMLHRYTRQEIILVGTPTTGRRLAQFDDVVGYFVNPVVMRADFSGDPTFKEFLSRVRLNALGTFEHQDYPFPLLVEQLQPARDPSRSPLFDVMFVLQKTHVRGAAGLASFALGGAGARVDLGDIRLESLALEQRVAQFDLTLEVAETAAGLAASLQYNTDLFDEETAGRMLEHWRVLLNSIVVDSSQRVSDLPLLSDEERRQLLVTWNETGREYAQEGVCLHQLFERQAERTPEAEAVVYEEERLSYRELNRRANALARHLVELGVGAESLVGVCLPRSTELLVAILGVLKAGGAYVPLDISYPKERLAFMLEDVQAEVLLTQEQQLEGLPAHTARVVCLPGGKQANGPEWEFENPAGRVSADNLAYVIYTSGSTGRPKGVAIAHHSAATLLRWAAEVFAPEALAGVLASTSICFDLSVFELFVPLSLGGKVILAENALQLPALFAAGEVTLLNTVPSALSELVRTGGVPDSVRVVNLAGEALKQQLVREVYRKENVEQVFNLYGPSEDTTYSTFALLERGSEENVTIGRPIANTEVYLLDRRLRPVPVGVAGELYLGGDGLARGYLNRPGLTAERFVPHPYAQEPGARLYRTGDLARYLADGRVEYLGRVDRQVKLRGYRIELGEVEAALEAHADVREAVVVAAGEGAEGRLVAYVVCALGSGCGAGELREHLRGRLPEYMVPAQFIRLEGLPLTPNGKVDRRALPEPGGVEGGGGRSGARTPVEEMLSGIWAEVLRVEAVGVEENFFDLGGHSLLATQVVSRVREMFQVELPLRALLEAPTVEQLARRIEMALDFETKPDIPRIEPRSYDGALPLSFAQQRLWFLSQLEPDGIAYNMAGALRLGGALRVDILEQSLSELMRRHESLRTTFPVLEGRPAQLVAPPAPFPLPLRDLSILPLPECRAEAERLARAEAASPFELAAGPLVRAALLRLSEEEHVLLLTMHHIVSDGWSSGLLVRELAALYEAFSAGRPSPLPEPTLQYGDYAVWQRRWLRGETLERQLDYWRTRLLGTPLALELPTDRPRPAAHTSAGATLKGTLPEELAGRLRGLSRSRGVTLFMTLLAGWQALLSRYSRQGEVVVGTPVANRDRLETEGLIGFFVNTLALRADLSDDPTFVEFLSRVREACLGAYAHQGVPFEAVVEAVGAERELSRTPVFQVMFVMQNAPREQPSLAGLRLEAVEVESGATKFDLTLTAEEDSDGQLRVSLKYRTDLFDEETAGRMLAHWRVLLEGAAAEPGRRISELPLLTDEERRRLLVEWNETGREYAQEGVCLHELFEGQAARTPGRVAVECDGERLSYGELNERANQLAHYLRRAGVGPETAVGLHLERGVGMVVAVLGVLKAGGAYLPLDADSPAERLTFMLRDAGVRVLLTQQHLVERLTWTGGRVVCVDASREAIGKESTANVVSHATPQNVAYVIYTSGSTGRPKAVMVQHRSAVNLSAALESAVYRHHESPVRVSVNAPLVFDSSVKQLIQLLHGHTLCVIPEEVRADGHALLEHCASHRLDVLDCTPTQLKMLLAATGGRPDLSVKLVLVGGEAIDKELWSQLASQETTAYYNVYGPTECTVDATVCPIDGDIEQPNIGRAINNVQLYVLDRRIGPVPVGVAGELYVGGDGLARGYLNRPGLTAEKFVPNPFAASAGSRLYRTGDLARYLADGRVEYLGRVDRQVKLRGYRIELGEVEAALMAHASVADAVAEVRGEGVGRLVAYVVWREGRRAEAGELREHLRGRLPEYMVPSGYVELERVPLTPNGKVDRRALPEPGRVEGVEGRAGARTPVEEMLSGIWAEVLGAGDVGVEEDFFALGGHSLLATQVVSRIRDVFRVEMPLRTLFETPTIAGLSRHIETSMSADAAAQGVPPLVAGTREGYVPLSFAQQRLWVIDQLDPHSTAYNIPAAVRLDGPLHVTALTRSLSELMRRHESLRTTFPVLEGRPAQLVAAPAPFPLPLRDLSTLPLPECRAEAERLARAEAASPFELAAGPLVRAALLRLSEEEHVLLLTMHHIVSDGWSSGLLVRELAALYEAFSAGRPSPLPEPTLQYGDYAVWQRRWLRGETLERQLDYWRTRLLGTPLALELPTDRPRPAAHTSAGATLKGTLPEELAGRLRGLSRSRGVTLFMTLLAGWQALLSRYSRQGEVVVGTPVANRDRLETEGLIGFFVNTLALRADLSDDPTFVEFLSRVREACLGAYAHQGVPFEAVVEAVGAERELSRTPVFQVMFVMQNAPREQPSLAGLQLELMELERETAKFDLTLTVEEQSGGLHVELEYRTDLFDEETAGQMLAHWRVLLEGAAAEPGRRVSELPLLTDEERRRLLVEWNETGREYAQGDACLHELFEGQAARTPGRVAVECDGERLSYGELNERANQLAHYLRRAGVGPETAVGLHLERGVEMVVAVLGVLKAGGAYLPLEPEYPAERVRWMVEDGDVAVVLTQQSLSQSLSGLPARTLCVDTHRQALSRESVENPRSGVTPANLAYVIYTSGSTGRPKGAMVHHGGVVNCLHWMQQTYRLDESDKFLLKTSLNFDPSVWELFWPLWVGASVHVARPGGQLDSAYLVELIRSRGITSAYFVPSMLGVFLDEPGVEACRSLRYVICGGEPLPVETLKRFFELLPADLHHSYGPTETSIAATEWTCEPDTRRHLVPMGYPLANTQVYVLDASLRPVPVGVCGELHIGGAGLGRGYLNRAGLTAERFIPDPFSRQPGARLYRTGDLVRRLPDGSIEFAGRVDEQIKLRGFRIEPGEIEATLRSHAAVRNCIVVVKGNAPAKKRLVAYVVGDLEPAGASRELRGFLKERLPEYMVPSEFVPLDSLPLMHNGKVDRRLLPEPGPSRAGDEAAFVAPRNEVEELLAGMWCGVLGAERIGIHENFFDLGGHSLMATQLVARVRRAFGVELPLRRLFESPTIAGTAESVELLLKGEGATPPPPIVPAPRGEELPLSFAQQRLWFLDQFEPDNHSYNLFAAVRLSGTLDVDVLARSFDEVVRRHEALRTVFPSESGRPRQVVTPPIRFELAPEYLLEYPEREAAALRLATHEVRCHFDLTHGPLLRIKLWGLEAHTHLLLLTMHHIVSDGWSSGLLVRELAALYEAFSSGRPSPLPELAVQYADYAVWQRRWLRGETLERQLDYWRTRLLGAPAALELPTDRPRPAAHTSAGATLRGTLPEELAGRLRELSRAGGVTLFMTLLAGWQALLSRYSGQGEVVVGTPVANRDRLETEGLIGFFVNTLALRADLSDDPTFVEFLSRVREACLGAYAHQGVPFEAVVEAVGAERELSRTPVFQVMFVMQNAPREQPSLAGLRLEAVEVESGATKFDLTLTAEEDSDGQLRVSLKYRTDLFDEETAGRMLAHWRVLLEGAAAEPGRRISELPLLTDEERRRLLVEWNETGREYAQEGVCLHELFEGQAARTPGRVAVECDGERLSYGELNERANQLAHYLRRAGVGPETAVGLHLERGVEMVVAVLGVLKAGGAYLPLDPDSPAERVRWMVEDGDVAVVLTQQSLSQSLSQVRARVVCLDVEREIIAGESVENPGVFVAGDNLVYVIYTSGSTGRPKAVMVRHRSVVNLQAALYHSIYAHHDAPLRVGVNAPLVFDASVKQLIQLLGGHTLCLIPEDVRRDATELLSYAERHDVQVLDCTPSQLRLLLAESKGRWPQVMLAGGEAIDEQLWSELSERRETSFYNVYGPTECTVDATVSRISREATRPTIGRPIANTEVYLLDPRLRPVPVGVAGELYLGGEGLARGYLNRPGLTAERFVPHPYAQEPGARLYRTGDLARYLADGRVEYLGRVDRQVKLRGYRIELGEVEAALEAHADVREAVVVAAGEGAEGRLVAYVVCALGSGCGTGELREHLRGRLPEYMVPAQFIRLEGLPLTPNGKVDRRALPEPGGVEGGEGRSGARTPVEEMLSGIWAEVLRVEAVGVEENFFDLGGHSLLATQVVSRVRETFQVELALRNLFERPTVAGLAMIIEEAMRNAVGIEPSLTPRSCGADSATPLSFAQQRLWFLDQLAPGDTTYNLPAALRLLGHLDIPALEQALTEVIRRHESLRTIFPQVNGEPFQVVVASSALLLPVIDLSEIAEPEQEVQSRLLIREAARRPFELAAGPLVRAALLRLSEEEHVLLLTMHHIVSDGWSSGLLVRELAALYEAFSAGRPSPLPEPTLQYGDYAVWQRGWLRGETLERQLDYWRTRLLGAPAALELPTDRPRPAAHTSAGATLRGTLPEELAGRLRGLSRSRGVTLFMTLLAGWQALLSRYSGQGEVVVGTPVANRDRLETEGVVGFFVNTLALRADLSDDPTFGELLGRVREACLGAYAHQGVPFEAVVEAVGAERELSRTPVFQVMFVMQNEPAEGVALAGLRLEVEEVESGATKFDLTLRVEEESEGLRVGLEYRTDLFDEETVGRMLEHWRVLLNSIVADSSQRVSDLPLLSDEERRQLLVTWNETGREYAPGVCLHQLFERQAERTPEAEAVVYEEERLSYRELNRRANALARHLVELGVGAESLVGVCLPRSTELLVAILGVLKAGGAYVPLDISYPKERLAFMLEDVQAHVLLTQEQQLEGLPAHTARVVCLPGGKQANGHEWAFENPAGRVSADNLAYVIYTSGSTGRPKGVAIAHHSAATLLRWAAEVFAPEALAGVLASTSICFDLSVFELFVPLSLGGKVILAENALQLPALSAAGEVTLLNTVPSAMSELVRTGGVPDSVRVVNLAGEALKQQLVREVYREENVAQVFNLYGPSEDTTYSTFALLERGSEENVTIGRPIANTEVYLLDPRLRPVPVGVAGELYLGGDGLARGYLNRPGLTAERFVPHPYAQEPGARLYRTGDLARYLADGRVEYLGRVDRQVKLRGYRIELGEVEAALEAHADVREAVVVAAGEGTEGRLVAYVVCALGSGCGAGELREHLRGRLPEYMVPAQFIRLEGLPLTPNGKVDRRALPEPGGVEGGGGRSGARTPVEEMLSGIWAEVLRVEAVGVEQNFFDLGGHSLLATQVVSRARAAFHVELPLRALFEHSTVEELAAFVEQQTRAGRGLQSLPISPVNRREGMPLSFTQQRLWLLDQMRPGSAFYNVSTALGIKGALDASALEHSLNEMLKRHEVLRTTFTAVEGRPAQIMAESLELELPVVDVAGGSAEGCEAEALRLATAEAQRPFDLSRGPLLRALLLRLGDERHVFVLTMHHIVSDHWSGGIFLREMLALYEAFSSGAQPSLPEPALQYADVAYWQRRWQEQGLLDGQLAYWKRHLRELPHMKLPTRGGRTETRSSRGRHRRFVFPAELALALRAFSREEGVTLFMTLLAAFKALLYRYTGQTDVVVGSPIANRNRPEIESVIGCLINELVMRTDVSGNPTFRELLRRVREMTLDAYAHQDVSFEEIVAALQPERSRGHTPLVRVQFDLHNAPMPSLDLPGLVLEQLEIDRGAVQFDLIVAIRDAAGELSGLLGYSTDLFDEGMEVRLVEDYLGLLAEVTARPESRLDELTFGRARDMAGVRTAAGQRLEDEAEQFNF